MSDILFRLVIPSEKIAFKTLMLKGDRGAQGVSIVSIEKTSTVGLIDYYTITMNNGDLYHFEVKNGANAYCDDELSLESENAVQNKVITAVINGINASLEALAQYDNALSATSENAVQNKVIKAALDSITTTIESITNYDSALSASSENAVQNKVVTQALNNKADSSSLNNYYPKADIDNLFDNLGASSIDFNNEGSGLNATDVQAAIDEVVEELGGKQDELTAGDNVQISGGIISATDTKAGSVLTDNTPAAISVPSSTSWQNLVDTPFLNVEGGALYLVQITFYFASNATGYRGCGLNSSSTTAPSIIFYNRVSAVNGGATVTTLTTIVSPANATSYYLWVLQNSGSALNVQYRFRAVRLR